MSQIRLLPLLTFASIVIGTGAMAQDAEYRTSTAGSAPSADFSGVGLGVDVGVGLGSAGKVNASGAIGGGHIGYNFQASRLVGGVEADFLTSGVASGSLTNTSFKQTFLSSTRVKGGWIFGDLMAYGTIGYAYSTSRFQDISGSASKTIKGAVYGGGAEFAVTRNVSVRAEYLRYDFGTQTYVTPLTTVPLSTKTNLVRAGASVHF